MRRDAGVSRASQALTPVAPYKSARFAGDRNPAGMSCPHGTLLTNQKAQPRLQ